MKKIPSNNNPFTEQPKEGQTEQPPIPDPFTTYRSVRDSYTACRSPKNHNSLEAPL